MNINQCEEALQTQYDKNPNQLDNISQLTNASWKLDKANCFAMM